MISAKEAYNKSKESIKRNVEKTLEQIEMAINTAIEKGEFEIYFREEHGEYYDIDVVKTLKDKGFRVKMSCAEIDDYGNYYCKYLRISWKNNGEKSNCITDFLKLYGIYKKEK